MRLKLTLFVLAASCLPAMADHLPPQGNGVSVSGRAHIVKGALGTYIHLDNAGPSVTGYVPFGDGGASAVDSQRVKVHALVDDR